MRKAFVVGNLEHAKAECPWGSKFHRVEGGYMVFESPQDYATWQAQK